MFAKAITGSLCGLEPELTLVEVDLAAGIPSFVTVGLPDASVREAKERIRAAIINSGYKFPNKRITTNLSPAGRKKEGTHYDLAIAMGILFASRQVKNEKMHEFAFLGELSLDGKLGSVKGTLPLVIGFRNNGVKKVILPAANAEEASAIPDVKLYPAKTLLEVAEAFEKEKGLALYEGSRGKAPAVIRETEDFADVAGQEGVKRALQIAAAAQHNLMMLGPPGSGKTMMARRIPGILPAMTYEEQLEVTQIYSIAEEAGKQEPIARRRPFRAPHHTVSAVALVGGGRSPKPGEVSLAHRGVLFLDELPEFGKHAIEMLRQPVEDEQVVLTRVAGTYTYPSQFMLVISMNPCPCGNFGSPDRECICTMPQIRRYLAKLSSPLLDRIDLQLEIFPVQYEELAGKQKNRGSKEMREEVEAARLIQLERYKKEGILYNAQLRGSQIERFCKLDPKSKGLLEEAFQRLSLSARAYSRIIKLARTIADLAGRQEICAADVAEAIGYRSLDKKYRGI